MTRVGWDDPRTVRYYEEFDRRHDRYRRANAELGAHARLADGQRVLDLAAGLGGTALAALAVADCRIACVEPARAMRARGEQLVTDSRVTWQAQLPEEPKSFDRVLCGAAVWLPARLVDVFTSAATLLRPGGAFAFTIPSAYLGEPDEPGAGRDPLLLELVRELADGRSSAASPGEPLPDAAGVDALLRSAGFVAERWRFRVRLDQAAQRDLLKVPVLTDWLFPELDPDERATRLDAAYARADPGSWRWEGWSGWTATKPG